MIKYLFCLLIICVTSIHVSAQTKYYQEYGKSRLLTEIEFKQKQSLLQHKYGARSSEAKVEFKIVNERTHNDSILAVYQVVVKLNSEMTMRLSTNQEKVYKLINKPFPEFELCDIKGLPYKFENLKGKPIVLNFWFNGCRPCKEEMPILNQIKSEYEDKVSFMSITFNTTEEVNTALKNNIFDFEHLVDAKALINKIGISSYPKTIIIDKSGYVRQIMECVDSVIDASGKIVLGDGDEIRNEIEKVL